MKLLLNAFTVRTILWDCSGYKDDSEVRCDGVFLGARGDVVAEPRQKGIFIGVAQDKRAYLSI